MSDSNHPEMHVNEEPRNDFMDVAMGFAVFFTCMCVVAIIATIVAM
jgi:hypothetical protein